MKSKSPTSTLTQIEARMAAGCIRYYLVDQLGKPAIGRIHRLYGRKLVKEMAKPPRPGTPLVETLKKYQDGASLMKQMVGLYDRLYQQSTPLDQCAHPTTGKPCSADQHEEAMIDLVASMR